MNTTRPRLGLSPDRMDSYTLLAVRKPAPTVAGDRRGDAEGGPSLSPMNPIDPRHSCAKEQILSLHQIQSSHGVCLSFQASRSRRSGAT